jgi:dephospho-CoA kinase
MAKIIEFFGPPGVGKSTIFKEIELRRKKNFKWITSKYWSQATFDQNRYFSFNFYKGLITKSSVDAIKLTDAGNRFIIQYPEFMDACWQNIINKHKVSYNKLDIRFQKAIYLQKQIQKIQVLRENDSAKVCLLDEGVVHLIPNALYKSSNLLEEYEEIRLLIKVIPLPEAIISIDTDAKEIAQRLSKRSKVISMYRNLDVFELEILSEIDRERRSMILNILENQAMPILKIDSSLDVATNAKKVISFMDDKFMHLNKEVRHDFDIYSLPKIAKVLE